MRLARFKLAINGFDIMNILKIQPGKNVGNVKKKLEEMVLNGELHNKKTVLKNTLRNIVHYLYQRKNRNEPENNGYIMGTVENGIY